MRKKIDRMIHIFFCLIFILLILPIELSAAGTIDIYKDVSFTVKYTHNGKPISDVSFDVYYVANVNAYAEFTLAGDFKNYPVRVNGLGGSEWKDLAETLTAYVHRDKIDPIDSGKTDERGNLSFPKQQKILKSGLYLVIGRSFEKEGDIYDTEPFLICLPSLDYISDAWNYSVTVEPKHTVEQRDNPHSQGDETVERKVVKVWKDDIKESRPNKVIVELLRDGEICDTVTLSAQNNWRYAWGDLPKYRDNGLMIVYSVTEKKIDDYTVSVSRDGMTFTVTNTYSPKEENNEESENVVRKVQKIWDDSGYETKRPDSVTVSLLKNEEMYDMVVLSEENDWQYEWNELPKHDTNGKEIEWTISESEVAEYTAFVTQKGYTFLLTNSYNNPRLPQTGMLWWPVPVLSGIGLMFIIIGVVWKKRKHHE